MEWLWGVLLGAVLAGLGALVVRAAKSYADEAVKPVENRMNSLELDLAKHYVRNDSDVMKEIRRTNRKLLRLFQAFQVAIARKLDLTIDESAIDDDQDAE